MYKIDLKLKKRLAKIFWNKNKSLLYTIRNIALLANALLIMQSKLKLFEALRKYFLTLYFIDLFFFHDKKAAYYIT